jgi:putative transposase
MSGNVTIGAAGMIQGLTTSNLSYINTLEVSGLTIDGPLTYAGTGGTPTSGSATTSPATISAAAGGHVVLTGGSITGINWVRGSTITGVDLGLKAAATLSSGESIDAPKPLKAMLRRLKIRSRRLSRKVKAAKVAAGFAPNARLPKGAKLPVSNNRKKSAATLARLHARIANIRADFLHKLTTRLCRENQAVVVEDLHVKGMLANDNLARALSDVGFGQFRAQMEYKAKRYGTRLVIADRWYPSSRLCSVCGWKNEALTLKDREWTCPACGTHHDRDHNAALNLKRLATATALSEASPAGNGGATAEGASAVAGKVTPVRDDGGHQDTSGQEGNRAHLRARS